MWPLVQAHPEYLIQKWEDIFFLWYVLDTWDAAFSYTQDWKKRKYFLSGKSTTKQKIKEIYPHVISFHPMMMNMMYLSPSERRKFLDEILSQAFPEYGSYLQKYKKILTSRNRVLKNIHEGKSGRSEIDFWNLEFIKYTEKIYIYRKKICDFFIDNSSSLQQYFFGKVKDISFVYDTKTDISAPWDSIKAYINSNFEKEILLKKTLRWPHLDDFQILLDGIELIQFASRWEVKSIILWLKFLETDFLKKYSSKSDIIFIIDDLLSELDEEHRKLLLNHIDWYQSIMSSIEDFEVEAQKIYI